MRNEPLTSDRLSGMAHEDLDELSRYFAMVPDLPFLTVDQEATATPDQLVEHNLRWAVDIALQYARCGLPISDLIQEANIGLIKASRTFDASKGFRFTTYATRQVVWCVERAIQNQSTTIRIPTHAREQRAGTSGRTRRHARAAAQVESLYSAVQRSGGNEGGGVAALLVGVVPSALDTASEALDNVEQMERRETIAQMLAQLNPRERMAVDLHFVQGKTFAESAAVMGCTSQRVHQIVKVAHAKMTRFYLTGRAIDGERMRYAS